MNHLIRAIDVVSGTVTTISGRQGMQTPFSDGIGTVATFNEPSDIALTSNGAFALVVGVTQSDRSQCVSCFISTLRIQFCFMMRLTSFVLQADSSNNLVRLLDVELQAVSSLAGRTRVGGYADGVGTQAVFNNPCAVALDRSGVLAIVVC
jgi:hypothetical protein